MAGINHAFSSTKSDSADSTLVRPSNWNADHVITGNVEFAGFNITTSGATFTMTISDSGTPITAVTLGGVGIGASFSHIFDVGNNSLGRVQVSSEATTTNGPFFTVYFNKASPAANDQIGGLSIWGRNTTPADQKYGAISCVADNVTAGSVASHMVFNITNANSDTQVFTLGLASNFLSDYAHQFNLAANGAASVDILSTDTGTQGPALRLYFNKATQAVNDVTGAFVFYANNTTPAAIKYASIFCLTTNVTAGTEGGKIRLQSSANGTVGVNGMTIGGGGSGGGGVWIGNTGSETDPGQGNLRVQKGILAIGPTQGIGYTTGAGGTITQTTSRSTTVTLNACSGQITLVSAAGSATATTFTFSNTAITATDLVLFNQVSGTDKYEIFVTAVGSSSCNVTFFTTGGTTTEQPVFAFAVIKGATA